MSGRPRLEPQAITKRQLEVARLVAQGFTNEQIARELGISHDGAKYHVSELLGRLGFERREEIAAWYREREQVSLRTRLRSLIGAPFAWGAAGAAAVAAIVLLGLVFEGALLRGGDARDREAQAPAQQRPELPTGEGERHEIVRGDAVSMVAVEYAHEHNGEAWRTQAGELAGRHPLFLIWDGPETRITAFEPRSGELLGDVSVFPPDALVAHHVETGRLIVSQALPPAGTGDPVYRFLVLDISDGLALAAEVVIEDRLPRGSPGYMGPQVREMGQLLISNDGELAYYLGESGDTRTPNVLGIIDIAASYSVVARLPLDGCGGDANLYPTNGSSVILVCDREIQVISSRGDIETQIDAGSIAASIESAPGAGQAALTVPIVAAAETSSGIAIVFSDGSYAVADGSDLLAEGNVLPQGRPMLFEVWRGDVLKLDSERFVLPYYHDLPAEGPMSSPPAGFVIVNMESGQVEYDVVIEHYGTYPVSNHEVVLIGEQRVDILDLLTMSVSGSFRVSHPSDLEGRKPAVR